MSQRYPGGLIIKNPVAPTASAAPGIWTLDQAIQYIKSGNWPLPPPVDPYFNQTVLLLHGDGTDGAQNNTFLDSSTNNFTITRAGNTTQGTFSPFSVADGQWSNYFDGSGDYLSVAANSAFLYTGDFTVEMWVYPLVFSDFRFLFGTGGSGAQDQANIYANGTFVYFDGTNSVTSPTLNLNAWNHIAVTRNGTTIRAYANGVSGTSQTISGNLGSSANAFRIAERSDGLYDNNCYMSNLRVVNGTAVYTGSTYTVPTSPLTAIANTSLLTCQSNRFVDNSSNAFAITVAGNTSVQPFSPFAPSAAYSPTTNGGSGYFDGSGDVIYATESSGEFTFGTGDYTYSCWIYTTTGATSQKTIFGRTNGGNVAVPYIYLVNSTGVVSVYYSSDIVTGSTAIPANTWTHIVVSRLSGTTRIFVNGVQDGSSADTATLVSPTAIMVGGSTTSGLNSFVGYISNAQVLKGVGYSSVTVPTAPSTAVSGTELLCNFTNAGIFDNTGKNNLETVGNAQIDTTTKKYGTGSMEFDGTGDYLTMRGTPDLQFGTGDFTIECWVYFNSLNQYDCVIDFRSTGQVNGYPTIFVDTSSTIVYFVNSANRITSSAVSTGQFYHLAVCRSGTDTKMFIDGVQAGSTWTDTTNYVLPTIVYVGGLGYNSPGTYALDGFIDDLRITKGVARYTTTFTPPTQAFPNQ